MRLEIWKFDYFVKFISVFGIYIVYWFGLIFSVRNI